MGSDPILDQHDHVFVRLQRIRECDHLFLALRNDGVGDRDEVLLVARAFGDLCQETRKR
jgi:hypothetical protein